MLVSRNKMQQFVHNAILVMFVSLTLLGIQTANSRPDLRQIQLPAGFKVEIFADYKTKLGQLLAGARFMAFDANGNLYVSSSKGDKVLMLSDHNKDGIADEVVIAADNLNSPQGLAFVGDALLVANQDGIVRFEKDEKNISRGGLSNNSSIFISKLPSGGHTLKNIKLGPDGYLYINIGSSCNVCIETDAMRATILRYTTEGKPAGALETLGRHQQSAIWARGLRNSQGFAWHPQTGEMFAANNGADNRSSTKNGAVNDELPPEHINKIEAGKHYGWPHCWGGINQQQAQTEDPNFAGESGFCNTTQAPVLNLISHSTPIGITFLNSTNWPAEYQQDAIVAMHGSWNRKQLSGYKLVRLKFKNNQPVSVEDFATGWLQGDSAWGRPVDVAIGKDKALYISDDKAGAIYRITYLATNNH